MWLYATLASIPCKYYILLRKINFISGVSIIYQSIKLVIFLIDNMLDMIIGMKNDDAINECDFQLLV